MQRVRKNALFGPARDQGANREACQSREQGRRFRRWGIGKLGSDVACTRNRCGAEIVKGRIVWLHRFDGDGTQIRGRRAARTG